MSALTVIGPFLRAYQGSPLSVRFLDFRPPCGFPSPARDYEETPLDLNKYVVQNWAATFFFRVVGESMRDAGIFDGDYVAVDRSLPPQHGQIVLAVVNQTYTIKRLYRMNGVVELHASHPDFPPICFKEGDELEIWGVVTTVIRKL